MIREAAEQADRNREARRVARVTLIHLLALLDISENSDIRDELTEINNQILSANRNNNTESTIQAKECNDFPNPNLPLDDETKK